MNSFKIFSEIDVFICCAGGGSGNVAVREKSVKAFRRTMDLNLVVPFELTQLVLPFMDGTKGNILYISSIASKLII